MSALGQWLYDWQTLITGIGALAVGGRTILLLHRQIKQQDRQHDAARQSRFAVAKAKAPLAAVEIADHARKYLTAVEKLAQMVLQSSKQPFFFNAPGFPAQAAAILDALVESSDDPVLIDQISALYSEQQVMASRLADVADPSQHKLAIDDYVLQPLMMDAIAMSLLGFGRDDEPMQRLAWDNVENSANRLLRNQTVRSRILAYVADKKDRQQPVPLALRRHSV